MWYAEDRLVSPPFSSRLRAQQTGFLQGPYRIQGAYAYRTLLK
jgi:hypothetical protein